MNKLYYIKCDDFICDVTNRFDHAQDLLKEYQKDYPNKEAMGTLKFEIIEMRQWDRKTIQVIGKFTLIRTNDTPTGHFTLLLRKIKRKWMIVSDHSS